MKIFLKFFFENIIEWYRYKWDIAIKKWYRYK